MDCLQRQTFDEGILKELIDVICNACILLFSKLDIKINFAEIKDPQLK